MDTVDINVRDYPAASCLYTVHADYSDDLGVGTTTYTITAPRVSGTVVVSANHRYIDHVDVDTPYVCAEYGHRLPGRPHRTFGYHDHRRADRLSVNGIRLVGATVINTDTMRHQRLTRWNVNAQRPSGPHTSTSVPDATADRTAAVLHAVVAHWLTRGPITLALRIVAARQAARHAIADVIRDGQRIRGEIADARARLADLGAYEQALVPLLTARPTP